LAGDNDPSKWRTASLIQL